MSRPDRMTFAHAGAGLLATIAGMAAGHLVAAFLNPASSPVLSVGAQVIDLTPTPVKEWAIRQFGTADKPILIGSVMVGALLLASLSGVVARRRFAVGASLLTILVMVAGATALLRPTAGPLDVIPAFVTALIGLAVFAWLVRGLAALATARATGVPEPSHADSADQASTPTPGPAVEEGAAATTKPTATGADHPMLQRTASALDPASRSSAGATRRTVLVGSGLIALAAAAMGSAGQWVGTVRTRISDIVLPAAADSPPPLPEGLEETYEGISRFRTPNDDFYRVDINLTVPVLDIPEYELVIDGDVDNELRFSFDDLAAMPLVERDITMTCVSNEVGGRLMGSARWLGIPIMTLLDQAGIGDRADQLLSTAVDGFTISTPLEVLRDGRDALVVIGMNGEPLPREHGFPVRLVTPGIYGFVGSTKWLTKLTLTTYAEQEAYWTERDWATDAPVKISSRIDTPRPFTAVAAGQQVIGGVAWAQTRGIAKVEVRIDGGNWQQAELGPDAGLDYWRQWYLPWDAEPGSHMLSVRATDLDGEVQTATRARPFPEGSSGIQEIVVTVGD